MQVILFFFKLFLSITFTFLESHYALIEPLEAAKKNLKGKLLLTLFEQEILGFLKQIKQNF